MPNDVLVTGGAGFMGSHVVDSLVGLGHRVIVLDDLSGGFRENVHPAATFIEGSILDERLVADIFADHEIRFVYHLAAYAAEGLSHFIKRFNYQNNLVGSVNLVNESINHGVECFVFTSSIAVYGRQELPMREEMVPAPEDPYGIAKLAVERELQVSREMFGLDYVVFRPHNVYGERQNIGDRYRNVIGIFMNQILRGEAMTIFGDGEQSRAFSYVGEIAPIIARAAAQTSAHGQVFNLGSDQPTTVRELAHEVAGAMGTEAAIHHLEPRNEVEHAYSSHEKVARYFDLPTHVPLRDGLRKMAGWAKEVGAQRTSSFGAIEIKKKLPPSWLDE